MSISEIQREHWEWEKANFPNKQPWQPVFGLIEELGELAHAELKAAQGIRGDAWQHEAEAWDAVGDIVIYLISYCNGKGWDLEHIIEETWAQVRRRDWKANPETGTP
jgi:NTP pyrophosphatase (non-canonical NTP hydrolase)